MSDYTWKPVRMPTRGPSGERRGGLSLFGPYRSPDNENRRLHAFTRTVPADAYRGFGTLQVTWAYESQMDIIAEKLGFDPLEFRLKNLLGEGRALYAGDTPVDCDLKRVCFRPPKKSAGV